MLEMPMTREQMLEYITAYESGAPVKDFYTRDQVQKWLYEFCLDGVQMTPPENREGGGVRLLNTLDDNALD
jgi:hypothetical protein